MDWDAKITEICEKIGIDPQIFNENETAQAVVSQQLGFSSYDSFLAFPDPIAVIDGRGLQMIPEHCGYQHMLMNDCFDEIEKEFNLSQNEDERDRQATRLLDYAINNFQIEHIIITAHLIENRLQLDTENISSWYRYEDKYGGAVANSL